MQEDNFLKGFEVEAEAEEATGDVAGTDYSAAVVTDTDWTAETVLSQLGRGNIQLNPRFQRRDAWDQKKKSKFIESLFLGLPVPQIVLAERKERRGAFVVLDGKQRLLTLTQFALGSSFYSPSKTDASSEIEFRRHSIRSLEVLKDLNGKSLSDIEQSAVLQDSLNMFLNQTVRTVVVRSWPSEDFLNMVFLRLNTGSVQLSTQELRQALHPGKFSDFLDDFASSDDQVLTLLSSKGKPDFRMRDVELVLRFFGFKLFFSTYSGNLKHFLDSTAADLNASWEYRETEIRALSVELNQAIRAAGEIFGKNRFQRWNPARRAYEGRFNRSVFDVIVGSLSVPAIREVALGNPEAVELAFRNLTENSPEFDMATQTTTKSTASVQARFGLWQDALQHSLAQASELSAGTRRESSSD